MRMVGAAFPGASMLVAVVVAMTAVAPPTHAGGVGATLVVGAPMDVLRLGSDVAGVLIADKARSRLFWVERGGKELSGRVASDYAVTGSGIENGVYRIARVLEGVDAPARSGPVVLVAEAVVARGAADRDARMRTVWVHGRASADVCASEAGCVAVSNQTMVELARMARRGRAWLIAGEDVTTGREVERRALADSVMMAIESWRKDWSSLDTVAYLRHYHPDFRSGGRDLAAWVRYKRRVNAGKRFVRVSISRLTLLRVPARSSGRELVLAEFDQRYRSDNYADYGRKRLLLTRGKKGEWLILSEENALE